MELKYDICIHFGLTPYMAQKWLNHFCEKGIMVKKALSILFAFNECIMTR
jgi:hypothetical protein